jgi:hypothetical protein
VTACDGAATAAPDAGAAAFVIGGRLTGGVLMGLSAGGLSTGGLSSASLAFVKVQITVSSAASSMVAVAPGGPSG